MSVGRMTLHRFNGDEIFDVESATITYLKNSEGGFEVTFRADAASPPIQSLPDTEELRAKPFAEWTIVLPKTPVLELRADRTFVIPTGYDESYDHPYRTNFYYCEHETMEKNEITILNRNSLKVRARGTGSRIDVNFYDDSKPRTKVEVEAEFTIDVSV